MEGVNQTQLWSSVNIFGPNEDANPLIYGRQAMCIPIVLVPPPPIAGWQYSTELPVLSIFVTKALKLLRVRLLLFTYLVSHFFMGSFQPHTPFLLICGPIADKHQLNPWRVNTLTQVGNKNSIYKHFIFKGQGVPTCCSKTVEELCPSLVVLPRNNVFRSVGGRAILLGSGYDVRAQIPYFPILVP